MAEPHDLILGHLRAIRAELSELPKIRNEMREGFATQRAHYAATHGDQALLERIKKRLDISEE
jgi:hypothetical protein